MPLKKTSEVDVAKPLKTIIATTFSTSESKESDSFKDSIDEFNQLRTNAVCRTLEKHEKSLQILYK